MDGFLIFILVVIVIQLAIINISLTYLIKDEQDCCDCEKGVEE